jgi:5-methylcytosine-specific restriction endonuclease McrA
MLNTLCAYGCGREATEWDYVLPWSRGGSSAPSNRVPSCHPCNAYKGTRTPEEAGMTLTRPGENR